VRRAGSKIRVTAELIAPENGEPIWTGRYDRDMGDLFAMQDEITTSPVGGELQPRSTGRGVRPAPGLVERHHRLGPLPEGLSHYYLQTEADFETSIGLFQGIHHARSDAFDCPAISPPSWCRASSSDGSRAPANCGPTAMDLAESKRQARSALFFCLQIVAYLHAWKGHYEAAMDAANRASD